MNRPPTGRPVLKWRQGTFPWESEADCGRWRLRTRRADANGRRYLACAFDEWLPGTHPTKQDAQCYAEAFAYAELRAALHALGVRTVG